MDSITSIYYDWDTLSMSGKLSSPMLPLTASVKVYMEKDSLILISVSAPLMGEVARIEADNNEILAVNKMQNSFTRVSTEEIESMCPGGLTAIQNLLLGRISIIGSGELSDVNSDDIEIYPVNKEGWMILPNQDLEGAPYVYFYTVDSFAYLLDRFIVLSQDEAMSMDCEYSWSAKNVSIEMRSELNGKGISATLKLNYPDEKTKTLNRINLNSKYREVSLGRLLGR